MKRALFIVLISLFGCTGNNFVAEKFHYGQEVCIEKGFYAGCCGVVDSSKWTSDSYYYELQNITCPYPVKKERFDGTIFCELGLRVKK